MPIREALSVGLPFLITIAVLVGGARLAPSASRMHVLTVTAAVLALSSTMWLALGPPTFPPAEAASTLWWTIVVVVVHAVAVRWWPRTDTVASVATSRAPAHVGAKVAGAWSARALAIRFGFAVVVTLPIAHMARPLIEGAATTTDLLLAVVTIMVAFALAATTLDAPSRTAPERASWLIALAALHGALALAFALSGSVRYAMLAGAAALFSLGSTVVDVRTDRRLDAYVRDAPATMVASLFFFIVLLALAAFFVEMPRVSLVSLASGGVVLRPVTHIIGRRWPRLPMTHGVLAVAGFVVVAVVVAALSFEPNPYGY